MIVINILLLIGGLVMISLGANFLTTGAVAIAQRFRISPLVIGLTIVAMGTSAPELAVSLTSAINGNSDIALGNVVGSNIANILAILGVTALICPLTVQKSSMNIEIPFTILTSALLCVFANDVLFFGTEKNVITTIEGGILLVGFILFTLYNIRIAKKNEPFSPNRNSVEQKEKTRIMAVWKATLFFIGGLFLLVYGGRFFVDSASAIALKMGISEAVVGLTIVAVGTSLPEMATSIAAALRKEPDIAIGNVVGSNIFNILFILGATATITPISSQGIILEDFIVMIFSVMLLYFFASVLGRKKISRIEGGIFVLCYIVYTIMLVWRVL